mgnify:CR=1 FL=1
MACLKALQNGGYDMYSFESRIRYSETNFHKKLTLTGITNYFQDCSTFQSEDLGLGIEPLSQINMEKVVENLKK